MSSKTTSQAGGRSPSPWKCVLLPGQDSNLQRLDSKSSVLPVELPGIGLDVSGVATAYDSASLGVLMGSLIKKRRKRMRKKKHRKLLKRTRVQRRNKK